MQQLDDVQGVDLSVSDDDVRQAQAEADAALELLAELERATIEEPAGNRPEPAELVEKRALAEFARRRIDHTRDRAARARKARRLLALREVGQEVDRLAAERSAPHDELAAVARRIAESAAELRALCAGHDKQVAELITRASELRAEEPAPSGPRVSSAFVSAVAGRRGPDGVQHGRTQIRLIGEKRAAEAAAMASAGDADGAVALIAGIHRQPEPARADRYYRASAGQIIAESGPQSAGFAEQERDGRLVRLTEAETDAYMRGVLDDGHAS